MQEVINNFPARLLVHLILSLLGLETESRLVAIVIINYLLHLSAIYPFYKIARRMGVGETAPMAALLGLYVGAWHFYRFQLAPINDGIFNALIIWLIYLVFQLYEKQNQKTKIASSSKVEFFFTLLLIAIGVHFRLQLFLILVAVLVSALVTNQYRLLSWTMGLFLVGLTSLTLTYTLVGVDFGGISQTSGDYIAGSGLSSLTFLNKFLTNARTWFGDAIPRLLFFKGSLALTSVVCAFFGLVLGIIFTKGLRHRDFKFLSVSLMSLISLFFVMAFFAVRERYLLYLFPFLYLMVFLLRGARPIGYILVASVLVASVSRFTVDIPRSGTKFWLDLLEKNITLPRNSSLLISESPRYSYFFLGGIPAYTGELTWENLRTHERLFLVGDRDFIQANLRKIEHLAQTANNTFKLRNLMPDYEDQDQHQLLELYNFAPKNL